MIFRKYNVEFIEQKDDILGAYEQSEIGARICYKSEDVIRKDDNGRSITAISFIDILMHVNKHGSVAEHGSIYLTIEQDIDIKDVVESFRNNKYSYVVYKNNTYYITTNLRVIDENNWYDYVNKYLSDKTPYHVERLMFKLNTQCAISREAHRHRTHSPSEQSTRYCNYSKGKFGNEVSINVPIFAEDCEQINTYKILDNKLNMFVSYCRSIASDPNNPEAFENKFDYWMFGNLSAEFAYLGMLKCGAVTDEARTVLPLDTHTEFVHTATIWDWFNFCKLRCSKYAHKDIQPLANIIKQILIDKKYFTEEEFENYEDGWKLFNDKLIKMK